MTAIKMEDLPYSNSIMGDNKWGEVKGRLLEERGGGDIKKTISFNKKITLIMRFTNKSLGEWTPLEIISIGKNPKASFKCSCGKVLIRQINDILYGSSKSCGHIKKKEDRKCLCGNIVSRDGSGTCRTCAGIKRRKKDGELQATISMFIRNSNKYKEWRNEVLKKGKYTCALSLRVGGKLEVHHLYPFSKIMKEEKITIENFHKNKRLFNIDNGIVLDKEIHRNFHKQYGSVTTYTQFNEYKATFKTTPLG